MPKAFPVEFRRDMIAVARRGESLIAQVAKDFGVSESCLQRWLTLADIDDRRISGFGLWCGRLELSRRPASPSSS